MLIVSIIELRSIHAAIQGHVDDRCCRRIIRSFSPEAHRGEVPVAADVEGGVGFGDSLFEGA